MAFPGHAATFSGEHAILDLRELELEFSITGVLLRIGFGILGIDKRTVKFGPYLTGKLEGPANANGANGIQFIGIKQNLSFKGLRAAVPPKPVGSNTVDDIVFSLSRNGVLFQQNSCPFSAFLCMADCALGFVLVRTTYIMQVGCDLQDLSICPLQAPYMHAQIAHPLGVFPGMTARAIGKALYGKCLNVLDGQSHGPCQ